MQLTKEEEALVLQEVLQKLNYGMDWRRYRELVKGCAIWRRTYLRTYKDSNPSYERDREKRYYIGLIFRSIEQGAGDAKEALFSNDPFFTFRPHGQNPRNEAVAEAVHAVMDYNTTIPFDYASQFLRAYRQCLTFGISYFAPFYDYREMMKTEYSQEIDPLSGDRKVFIEDTNEAMADHPDFDIPYPTRVIVDPNAQFGKFHLTADWRIIERQRPAIWFYDKQKLYGYADSINRELKFMSGTTALTTEGPNNFDTQWNLESSKVFNELEYIGRIVNPKLRRKFDLNRRYIVTILNQQIVVRCDISTAPDGLGLIPMNIIPDMDGTHLGIGIASAGLDHQKALNEWYNLRMRGLSNAINPAYLVNQIAFPDWKQIENHPPGKIFPVAGQYDARKILQALNPVETSGNTWEQMVSFTQRDHDLTVGTSSSRMGALEDKDRTATELTQVKEGADRRSNLSIFTAIRTGHKPLLWAMTLYTMRYWSTPKVLNIIDNRTYERVAVRITPADIRNAQVILDIIDSTSGSVDQQMAFWMGIYKLSMMDPLIDHTAVLINMLKSSRIVRDPYSIITVDPRMAQANMMKMQSLGMGGKEGERATGPKPPTDNLMKEIDRSTNSDEANIRTLNPRFNQYV